MSRDRREYNHVPDVHYRGCLIRQKKITDIVKTKSLQHCVYVKFFDIKSSYCIHLSTPFADLE